MPICPRSFFFLLIEHFATAATLTGGFLKKRAFKLVQKGLFGAKVRCCSEIMFTLGGIG